MSTNVADLKGTYNALLYHLVPSNNYSTTTTQAQESFDAAGNCTVPVPAECSLPDDRRRVDGERRRLVLHQRGCAANQGQTFVTGIALTSLGFPAFPVVANANMVIGKINGAIVPIVVRTGQVSVPSPLTPANATRITSRR